MRNSLESIGCYGKHGWKEFHRNRKDILGEFDKLLEKTSNRPIQVAHGVGIEAYLRKWLTEFLPKKFGVTSGYIIPDLYEDQKTLLHFDVIIYNQLESPVLWTEGNEDQNDQGKYRAIPAEHVIAVFEVKSRFTRKNISEAFKKLRQTSEFKEQLHPYFRCYTIFVELKESDNDRESITKELIRGTDIFGFNGGMILRYEGDDTCTGLIKIFSKSTNAQENSNDRLVPIAKRIEDLNIFMTEEGNLQIDEPGAGVRVNCTSPDNWSVTKTYGVSIEDESNSVYLFWARCNFAEFCIELLGSLEGLPYNDKGRPSFGTIFDRVKRKDAVRQNSIREAGKPFIELQIYEGGEYGEKLSIIPDEKRATIRFYVLVTNRGDVPAIVSDDSFKSNVELNPGATALRPVSFIAESVELASSFVNAIEDDPLVIPYRLVYYEEGSERHFVALEEKIRISKNEVGFCE